MDAMEPRSDDPAGGYRLGLSGVDREAVQHVLRDMKISLCGKSVYPLPLRGWSMRFLLRRYTPARPASA